MYGWLAKLVGTRVATMIYGLWYALLVTAVLFLWQTHAVDFYYLRR